MERDLISIITINYNSYSETFELLDSLKKYLSGNNYDYEVIVVDNASMGDDYYLIKEKYTWVKVVRSNENLGFSGGNNLGIVAARGKYFFLLIMIL